MNLLELKNLLLNNKQDKLASQLETFSNAQISTLAEQIEEISFEELACTPNNTVEPDSESFFPSKVISLEDRAKCELELKNIGLEAYKSGEVAVVMVAGGQGTRLGFAGPKGCYKIGAVSKKSLYQIHAEKILATSLKFGHRIPFLVMTSSATDSQTRNFFKLNNNFGLAAEQVKFFIQANVPSLDLEGNLLLAEPGKLLTNPDGHGGCFTALAKSGLLEELKQNSIKHIIYIQVDNALAPIYDPMLIGLAISEQAQVITKVVEKHSADEKVGLLVCANGKDTIKEYINLPQELLNQKDSNGKLKYRAGNTAMHYWNLDFLYEKSISGFKLPLHVSKKPLKVWEDQKSKQIEGYKHERFIFDLIPLANLSLGLEVDRRTEFAPLKNSSGNDSPETVNKLCSELFKAWIKNSGIKISDAIEVEVSPLLAMDSESLKAAINCDPQIKEKITSSNLPIFLE